MSICSMGNANDLVDLSTQVNVSISYYANCYIHHRDYAYLHRVECVNCDHLKILSWGAHKLNFFSGFVPYAAN